MFSPWKETQINYLKSLQTADLQRRRYLYPNENEMFLAYEVVPVAQDFCQEPLILDFSKVYNLAKRNNRQEYVRGDLLGFCEITQRPYGIGSSSGIVYDDDPELEVRPILTNLAVKRDMRKYGIGSKLLDECERHVQKDWKLGDIVLEVEDYNTRALDFYSNRGYELIFDDPASRRYDVSGFVLRKVRCTRKVFRKVFDESSSGDKNKEGTVTIDLNFFKRIRETVGV
jgi:ribosomal protein S18 acetylase RimI-like enzyme